MSGNVKKTFVCILVNNVHYIPGQISTTDCHVYIPGSHYLLQLLSSIINQNDQRYGFHTMSSINSSLRVDAHRLGFDAAART